MIPTLNPFAPKSTKTKWGEESEMRVVDAADIISAPVTDNWQDLSNRASALYLTGLTEQALEAATRAVEIQRTIGTLVNMSVILETLGRFEEALGYAKDAATLDPEDGRARALYGEALLRMGRLAEGWPLYAEQRASFDWLKDFGMIEWDGTQDLKDKRLLVIEGGGYGDNIYFLRWLDTIRQQGAAIDYVCQPTFAPLVRHLGYNALENWSGNVDIRFHEYDYYTGLLALPWKLGVTFENYDKVGPYIRVGQLMTNNPMRVGICSLAGEGTSPRKQRSMHDSQLQPMLNALSRKHQWVNLIHRHKLPDIVDHLPLDDWLDTAKAIATCDLVVSVDTGVAHLAGAMGVPVWVLLPGASAWQYPLYRRVHPFYPSMRMFRNQAEGLDHAVNFVIAELNRL
jgi:hypothetical protein